ncbi:MAG: primosomal protein N' [Clostridia bacterium]|nr:primosomal protein N' [Clostridia bacterium]
MFAEVVVDVSTNSLDKIFDYECPKNIEILLGQRVLVPFGRQTIEGYVLNLKETTELQPNQVKQIIKPLDDFSLILPEMFDVIRELKQEYKLRIIDILHLIVPSQIRNGKVKQQVVKNCFLTEYGLENLDQIKSNAKNQIQACAYLRTIPNCDFTKLATKFGNQTINTLISKGYIAFNETKSFRAPMQDISPEIEADLTLTDLQQKAVDTILSKQNLFNLLFGVTGSGKTEVYMQVIREALKNNQTAIMLVPEISLTPKTVKQFRSRFGDLVAVLHSGLSDGEKFDEWFRLYNGTAKIAVGARSAIFAPLKNLGAIIIDEEHDGSYQSESNPRYETITVAKARAKYNDCPLVLGSATPTIETFYNAQMGNYNLITLDKRINKMPLPKMDIVDMCQEFRSGNTSIFSGQLLNEMSKAVNNNEQIMLFLNRRGFSSYQMCRECGYVAKCTDCDVSLVYHKEDNLLKCHYCGKKFKPLTKCPSCGKTTIKLGNTGTEKIEEELQNLFPQTKVFRMDNDTTTTKSSHAKILSEFEKTKPAILVGTQMIAKGHDFPMVTLVGLLDADLSLFYCDFKANEKTYQLVTQVAGRAGRAEKEGKVVLQTFFPKHYVYNFCTNYDYLRFYNKEINLRQTAQFPPFSKIIRVLVTAEEDDPAKLLTHELFLKFKDLRVKYPNDFIFLEAMRSPHAKIKRKYRYQVLMRVSENNEKLIEEIFEISNVINNKATVFVEVNPQNLS